MRRATGGCQGRFSVLCTFNLEIVWEMLHWNLATASPGLATYKKFQNSRLFTDSTKNHMCVECFIVIDFISTEGALRLPTTYDNHSNPIPSHPSVHPSTNLATFGLHSGYILAQFWPQSDYISKTNLKASCNKTLWGIVRNFNDTPTPHVTLLLIGEPPLM